MKVDILNKIKERIEDSKHIQRVLTTAKHYRYSLEGILGLLLIFTAVYLILLLFGGIEYLLGWQEDIIISFVAGISVNAVLIWVVLAFIINFKSCDKCDYLSFILYNILLLAIISAFYVNYGVCAGVLFTFTALAETFAIWYRIIGYRKIENWVEKRNKSRNS